MASAMPQRKLRESAFRRWILDRREIFRGDEVRGNFITGWVATAALGLALTGVVPSPAQARHPEEKHTPHPAPPRPQQNAHSGQWLRQHKDLPPAQQKKALENDPQFRKLPPQQKQQLQNQLDRFNNLPPEKRQQMLNRMDTWGHLTPDEKDTARQLHSQMQQLPEQRRQAVRNAIQTLRAMPPEARQRQIDSDAYKKQFTPEERNILGGASKLPLAPAGPNEPDSPEE
jgi:hypothetical protein